MLRYSIGREPVFILDSRNKNTVKQRKSLLLYVDRIFYKEKFKELAKGNFAPLGFDPRTFGL